MGLEATQRLKSNAGLPYVHVGSCRHSLAVFAVIGSVILVTFTIVHSSTPWFRHKQIEKPMFPTPHSKSTQLKQQIVDVPTCNYEKEDVCPVLTLFHNPEVHEVATDNLMRVGHGHLKAVDRTIVKAAVAAGFKNISFKLQMHAPKVAKELRMVDFSEMQKNAVLDSMRLMSNPRVQSIGRDIGQAIHDSNSTDREDLKLHILAKLQPRLPEIMQLRSELIPEMLRLVWGGGHQWTMTLDEENIRLMGPYRNKGKHVTIRESAGTSEFHNELAPFLLTTYSILGGVLEEGRALLDIIELCGHLFGRHLKVPYWITYLGGSIDVTSEFLSCGHRFVNSNPEDMKLNSINALFCTLKFGTQGMDALKAAFDMDGEGRLIPDTKFAPPSLVKAHAVPPAAPMIGGPAQRPWLRIVGA